MLAEAWWRRKNRRPRRESVENAFYKLSKMEDWNMKDDDTRLALLIFWLVLAVVVVTVSDSLKASPEGQEFWKRFTAVEH